ncbi:MAG: glycosyltransferase family 39 protein [Dehalococcoidia bacterium]|nr:glycosyltransferase family 39 protein [Dehalococcoidia bacterium]
MPLHAYWSQPRTSHRQSGGKRPADQVIKMLLVLIVIGVAVFLRTYRLDTLPPGLFYDEASNGLDVLDILNGKLSIFFERNYGREPLFIYFQAFSAYLLGPNPFALRLTSAVVGVVTIVAIYVAAKRWFGYRVGLISMTLMTVSFWHVDLSRIGFRAITAPLFLILSLLTLEQALQSRRRRYFLLSGVILGILHYTYISARLSVPLILAILLVQFALDRQILRGQVPSLALFFAAAFITVLPLGAYFWSHPSVFLERVELVSLAGNLPATAVKVPTFEENLLANAGMFFLAGDSNWRHNLSGRPVFDPVLGALFLVGIGWALLNVHRKRGPNRLEDQTEPSLGGRRVTHLLPIWLILWLIVMMIPGIMSLESPNYLRLVGTAPAVFILAALGVVGVWEAISQRFGRSARIAVGLSISILIAWEGHATFDAYFDNWAKQSQVYWSFDTNLAEAAQFLNKLDRGKTEHSLVYFYVDRFPTIKFLANQYADGNWLREDTSFVPIPDSSERDAYYVIAHSAVPGVLPHHFPDIPIFAQPLAPNEAPAFTVYRVPAATIGSLLRPQRSLGIKFGSLIELLGASDDGAASSSGYMAGKSYYVSLLWRMLDDNSNQYSLFVHSVDEKGHIWSQQDAIGFSQGGWRKGDLIYSRHEIIVPADVPAIPAKLVVGATVKKTGERLKPATNDPGNLVKLGDIDFVRGPATQPISSTAVLPLSGKELLPGLEVLRGDIGEATVGAGETLNVEITWRLARQLKVEPIIEVRLTDGRDKIFSRQRGAPGYGHFPFSKWGEGDIVRDPRAMTLTGVVPAGAAHVIVAALSPDTGLPLGEIDLGFVTVADRARDFAAPAPQQRLNASFGDQIALLGYDLSSDSVSVGGSVKLTLYWQAITTPTGNYTVFTHLLDSTNVVVGQQDNVPQKGTYPTPGWAPKEVVKDEYELFLKEKPATAEITLEAGLYEPGSGLRLQVDGTNENRAILGKIRVGN